MFGLKLYSQKIQKKAIKISFTYMNFAIKKGVQNVKAVCTVERLNCNVHLTWQQEKGRQGSAKFKTM